MRHPVNPHTWPLLISNSYSIISHPLHMHLTVLFLTLCLFIRLHLIHWLDHTHLLCYFWYQLDPFFFSSSQIVRVFNFTILYCDTCHTFFPLLLLLLLLNDPCIRYSHHCTLPNTASLNKLIETWLTAHRVRKWKHHLFHDQRNSIAFFYPLFYFLLLLKSHSSFNRLHWRVTLNNLKINCTNIKWTDRPINWWSNTSASCTCIILFIQKFRWIN